MGPIQPWGRVSGAMRRFVGILSILAAAGLFAAACAVEEGPVDLEPPKFVSLTVTPNEVLPGQAVTIKAVVSDNVGVTGVSFLVGRNGTPASFCSGSADLTSGSPQLGDWTLNCVIPTSANSGQYEVGAAAIDGRLNGSASVDSTNPAVERSLTVLGDTDDQSPPQVESVTTTPSQVSRGSNVTISAHVTDETGTSSVNFGVRNATGNTMGWCFGAATLVSGDPTDGIWEMTCTVANDAAAGQYWVNTLVRDVQNQTMLYDDLSPEELLGRFTVQ